ncbi:hypothetical protein BGX23_002638 [Mortierella sp. AD031]|nr:hypothetical protein BGX23_002638 [Mortierella sp. AD031]
MPIPKSLQRFFVVLKPGPSSTKYQKEQEQQPVGTSSSSSSPDILPKTSAKQPDASYLLPPTKMTTTQAFYASQDKKLDHTGGSALFRSEMPMSANRLNQAERVFWLAMPPSPRTRDYCAAWSVPKNTVYLFGSIGNPNLEPGLWEFQFASKIWEQIVESLGGQKLVVFGGWMGSQIGSNIYIFDIVTYTWTIGAIAPDVRVEIACASVGDYFLFWGGSDRLDSSPADIVFYNIKTDKWVKQTEIAPPANTSTEIVPSSTSSTTGSRGSINTGTPDTTLAPKSNTAAIGGGIAGAIVVTVAIVGFLFVRRRHRTQAGTKRDGSPDIVAVALPENKSYTPLSPTHTSPRRTSNSYVGSSVEKAHAVGNPQMPTTPPANEGGGITDPLQKLALIQENMERTRPHMNNKPTTPLPLNPNQPSADDVLDDQDTAELFENPLGFMPDNDNEQDTEASIKRRTHSLERLQA